MYARARSQACVSGHGWSRAVRAGRGAGFSPCKSTKVAGAKVPDRGPFGTALAAPEVHGAGLPLLIGVGDGLGGAFLGRRGAPGGVVRRQGRAAARGRVCPGARRQHRHHHQPGAGRRPRRRPRRAAGAARQPPRRAVGALVALVALPWIAPPLAGLAADPGRAVANFHTLFNLALAVLLFPVLPFYAAAVAPPAAGAGGPRRSLAPRCIWTRRRARRRW